MSQPCPACGTESVGRFCSHCGAARSADCRECGSPLAAGGRFCNECGAAAGALPAAPAKRSVLPWAVAAVAVAGMAAMAVLPRGSANPPAAAAAAPAEAPPAATGMDASGVDLASMTPRERADRLFNRVMEGAARGDTAQLGFFADMAIQAYGMVPERDADLHYHLGELHNVRGDAAAVQAQADTILSSDPSHLLGLFTAARAARLRGDRVAAAAHFGRFVEVYADERARDLPEYREHAPGLPSMRAEAEAAAAEGAP